MPIGFIIIQYKVNLKEHNHLQYIQLYFLISLNGLIAGFFLNNYEIQGGLWLMAWFVWVISIVASLVMFCFVVTFVVGLVMGWFVVVTDRIRERKRVRELNASFDKLNK